MVTCVYSQICRFKILRSARRKYFYDCQIKKKLFPCTHLSD